VLTEIKASAGCRLLAEEFTAAGYAVHYPRPDPGEYGAMIISTVPAAASPSLATSPTATACTSPATTSSQTTPR
jgi:hypothetical protein